MFELIMSKSFELFIFVLLKDRILTFFVNYTVNFGICQTFTDEASSKNSLIRRKRRSVGNVIGLL
jgi:hypothetical protein